MPDVVLHKIETIKRCLDRIRQEYVGFEAEFEDNYTKQDSVILNLERASQAAIDIATHIVKVRRLGLPKTSRELFDLLLDEEMITSKTCQQMQAMVGFRNIAVHDYQNLNIEIVIAIVQEHLGDFERYCDEVMSTYVSTQL